MSSQTNGNAHHNVPFVGSKIGTFDVQLIEAGGVARALRNYNATETYGN